MIDKILSVNSISTSVRRSGVLPTIRRTLKEHDIFGKRWGEICDDAQIWKAQGAEVQKLIVKLHKTPENNDEWMTSMSKAIETHEKDAIRLPDGWHKHKG